MFEWMLNGSLPARILLLSSQTKLLENVQKCHQASNKLDAESMQTSAAAAVAHNILFFFFFFFCLFKAFLPANEAKASSAPIKQQLSITAKLSSAFFRLERFKS